MDTPALCGHSAAQKWTLGHAICIFLLAFFITKFFLKIRTYKSFFRKIDHIYVLSKDSKGRGFLPALEYSVLRIPTIRNSVLHDH